ncbi:antibiotic resistance protein VanZ [Listeria newyorkensis]|uniref:Antibiotic resistance protein VanZ n=1 Tax=Listeria newyorkensis TaxID=1497681 RepID=A0ABX4XJ26_9LIST|nr:MULTISPECIES: VanZ family protein [Listeria]KGL46200.1 antibiotic resistance protein VanZ [Listeriaceae bacterium FSL A5-0209]KGL43419.1 antibiotic resistance protein VanZ [Listeria newyorkensis]PNP88225.1 antibiotic resistance protein VanZ [Listeria newyorkensis]RQW65495.1 VanZ family protein [Listeria sp. SHR_NRA_18]SQC55304.1 VanZ like family [Listeria newyorkensis]
MKNDKIRCLVLLIPVLYMAYGIFLAIDFGSRAELINVILNGTILGACSIFIIWKATLRNTIDVIWLATFILYLFILHHLVTYISAGDILRSTYTGGFHIQQEMVNLVPFTTIENTVHQTLPTMPTIIQLLGNVLLLAPLTFFLLYFQITKRIGMTLLVALVVSTGIELVQFFQTTIITGFRGITLPENRSTDIDDIILNTLSGLLGILAALCIPSVRKRKK